MACTICKKPAHEQVTITVNGSVEFRLELCVEHRRQLEPFCIPGTGYPLYRSSSHPERVEVVSMEYVQEKKREWLARQVEG